MCTAQVLSDVTHTLLLTYRCLYNVQRLFGSKEPTRATPPFAIFWLSVLHSKTLVNLWGTQKAENLWKRLNKYWLLKKDFTAVVGYSWWWWWLGWWWWWWLEVVVVVVVVVVVIVVVVVVVVVVMVVVVW